MTPAQGIAAAVEAVDSYGLSRMSGTAPVRGGLVRPQVGLLPWLSRNSALMGEPFLQVLYWAST